MTRGGFGSQRRERYPLETCWLWFMKKRWTISQSWGQPLASVKTGRISAHRPKGSSGCPRATCVCLFTEFKELWLYPLCWGWQQSVFWDVLLTWVYGLGPFVLSSLVTVPAARAFPYPPHNLLCSKPETWMHSPLHHLCQASNCSPSGGRTLDKGLRKDGTIKYIFTNASLKQQPSRIAFLSNSFSFLLHILLFRFTAGKTRFCS